MAKVDSVEIPMTANDLTSRINELVNSTEHVTYRGVSVGQALKVPFGDYLRNSRSHAESATIFGMSKYRVVLRLILRILAGLFWYATVRSGNRRMRQYRGKGIVVVCDHPGSVEQMTVDLLDRFDKEDVILLTTSTSIFRRLKSQFPFIVNLHGPLQYYRWTKLWKYYSLFRRLLPSFREEAWPFKLQQLAMTCSIAQAVDYYNSFFDRFDVKTVMTMSDNHWNERVITETSRQRGIPTYTNQHGELAELVYFVPIASDKVFVWGEKSRDRLFKAGVDAEKIVVSGNPKFDRVFSWYLPKRRDLKNRICREYGLDEQLPVVTYLSTGTYGTEDMSRGKGFELFRCFAQASELPVNALAKLHPRQDSMEQFLDWLKDMGSECSIPLLQHQDTFDILAITDVAVTLYSTTGVEAIGFGIPTIVLNIIEGFDVREFMTYSDDAIECKTPSEFRSVLETLINEPASYEREVERTRRRRGKYFRNSETFNTSEFVRESVYAEIGQ